jgi:hypothetical protein
MFVALLLSGQLSRPNIVWNSTWEELSDDIQHKQRRLMNCQGMVFLTIFNVVQ